MSASNCLTQDRATKYWDIEKVFVGDFVRVTLCGKKAKVRTGMVVKIHKEVLRVETINPSNGKRKTVELVAEEKGYELEVLQKGEPRE